MDPAGRNAVVTAGVAGIGSAVAEELTQRGARVLLDDIDRAGVTDAAPPVSGDRLAEGAGPGFEPEAVDREGIGVVGTLDPGREQFDGGAGDLAFVR